MGIGESWRPWKLWIDCFVFVSSHASTIEIPTMHQNASWNNNRFMDWCQLIALMNIYALLKPIKRQSKKSLNTFKHQTCAICAMVKSWSDDVAEDSARQRFANYMRLQRRNARGDFEKRRLPCTLALENFVTPCNSSSFLFCFISHSPLD